MNTKRILDLRPHLHIPIWLGVLLVIVIILRIPNFFEPFTYGDEMIYLSLGEGIKKGLVLYKEIHDNKPPFLYYLAALAGNVFWFRSFLAIWSIATIIGFWKLAQKLFSKNDLAVKVATVFFAILFTIPLLEGNIANAENFMVGFSIFGFLVLLGKHVSVLRLMLGGILFSFAALFKIPAAFDLPAIFLFWIILSPWSKKSFLQLSKKILFVILGFLIPIVFFFVWYYLKGALSEYFIAAYLQNIGYLSSWRPDNVQKSFLEKNGPLLVRAFIVLIGIMISFLLRKRSSKGFLLASLWLLLSLFAVTLSERPYPHYLLQALPAVSIFVGLLVASEKLEQIWAIVPLALAVFVPVYYKFYYYNTGAYYSRFFDFATKKISREEYINKFDNNASRNYKIAEYINENSLPDDPVFVWGDSSAIYALSRRLPPIKYVAHYHINDFSSREEVIDSLRNNRPEIVVLLPQSGEFLALNELLEQNYVLIANIDGASIWKKVTIKVLQSL